MSTDSNARKLLDGAVDRHEISKEARDALGSSSTINAIQRALEGSYSVTKPGQILLVSLVPDDSQSMFDSGWAPGVILGHEKLVEKIGESSWAPRAMFQTRYLNGTKLNPFVPLTQVVPMAQRNYPASRMGTPLYTQSLVTLGSVIAKTEELTSNGARVSTATLLMTDGEPTDYNVTDERALQLLIGGMRASGRHFIAGMGFGSRETYYPTFNSMGIDPENIYSASSIEEIMRAFNRFFEALPMLTAASHSKTVVRT